MRVRVRFTERDEAAFRSALLDWEAAAKWGEKGGVWEGELGDLRVESNYLMLIRFSETADGLGIGSLYIPLPESCIFAFVEGEDGWQQLYSTCEHHHARAVELDMKWLSHSAVLVKNKRICSCGAEWSEWNWA
mgnify:CR=1 FL=1